MKCTLCNHKCSVDRSITTGKCGIDDGIYISHYGLHFGEEPFLVGKGGSGTVFFSGCSLSCRFCQNYQISRWRIDKGLNEVDSLTEDELAGIFRELESRGAENINFVSPTPYAHHIKNAVIKARSDGLKVPVVYNTHGNDSLDCIDMMAGIVDIYLPDFKYGNDETGKNFSGASTMYSCGKDTIKAMYDQVGLLETDIRGVAVKGIAVRHLVLPGHIESTLQMLDFLHSIDRKIHISLMSQYHPTGHDDVYPELNRTLHSEEYERAVDYAHALGLRNVYLQDMISHKNYLPDFDRDDVFSD